MPPKKKLLQLTSKISMFRNVEFNLIHLKKLAILITIFMFFIILIISPNPKDVQIKVKEREDYEYFSQWLVYDPKVRIKPEFDRFIYSNRMDSGLGNQMYRFASLYAMGQLVNRTPVFLDVENKIHEIDSEIGRGFPNWHKRIYFINNATQNSSEIDKIEPFDKYCCDYADTKIIFEHNSHRFLWLHGPGFFENSKYFHKIRSKIIELFQFGEEIMKNVTAIIQREFKLDNAYKICVHTRNGDFVGLGVSKAEQVGPAIDRIIGYLPSIINGRIGNYSLVLFGEDQKLLHSLKYNKNVIQSTYFVTDMKISRIGELYFAQQICNLFLDTASLSSFAFWMGYLMPENLPKFFIRKHINQHFVDTFDTLPPEWFPMEEDWLKLK